MNLHTSKLKNLCERVGKKATGKGWTDRWASWEGPTVLITGMTWLHQRRERLQLRTLNGLCLYRFSRWHALMPWCRMERLELFDEFEEWHMMQVNIALDPWFSFKFNCICALICHLWLLSTFRSTTVWHMESMMLRLVYDSYVEHNYISVFSQLHLLLCFNIESAPTFRAYLIILGSTRNSIHHGSSFMGIL
jgi:hypothetical protein